MCVGVCVCVCVCEDVCVCECVCVRVCVVFWYFVAVQRSERGKMSRGAEINMNLSAVRRFEGWTPLPPTFPTTHLLSVSNACLSLDVGGRGG